MEKFLILFPYLAETSVNAFNNFVSLQGVPNPVPRVQHPDWLHKKIVEKNDTLKQRKISEMFTRGPKQAPAADKENQDVVMRDIEDTVGNSNSSPGHPLAPRNVAIVSTTGKRKNADDESAADLEKNWREVLGNPPKRSDGLREWIKFQKRKWQFQARQRREQERRSGTTNKRARADADVGGVSLVRSGPVTMAGFLRRTQRTLMDTPWQIIQLAETATPGLYRLWALVGADLHCIKLTVPRIFYVNQKSAKEEEGEGAEERMWRKCQKTLPRSHPVYHLYEYRCVQLLEY
jgi:DNA polymerase epsilon subunit 1